MTFIVKTAATLRLADGSSFDLIAGMHDDFPANVKKHWAFASYAEPVDTSKQDSADQKGAAAAKKQIKQLQTELKNARAEIDTLKARITELEAGDKNAQEQPATDS